MLQEPGFHLLFLLHLMSPGERLRLSTHPINNVLLLLLSRFSRVRLCATP